MKKKINSPSKAKKARTKNSSTKVVAALPPPVKPPPAVSEVPAPKAVVPPPPPSEGGSALPAPPASAPAPLRNGSGQGPTPGVGQSQAAGVDPAQYLKKIYRHSKAKKRRKKNKFVKVVGVLQAPPAVSEVPAPKAVVPPPPSEGGSVLPAPPASAPTPMDNGPGQGPPPGGGQSQAAGDDPAQYLIELQGALEPYGGHLLIINQNTHIRLQLVQFLVLFVLACHARTQAGLPSPIKINGGDYLSPARIERYIHELKAGKHGFQSGKPRLSGCLPAVTQGLIYNAKWEIRLRIMRALKNPAIFNSIDGVGYQLAIPAAQIKIKLIFDSGNEVWDWLP